MKIESMEAVSNNFGKNITVENLLNKGYIKNTDSNAGKNNISSNTASGKIDISFSEKYVIEAIEKANKAISGLNTRFEFAIHEKTKAIMVKVVDSESNEIIREIPPEKILDLVARMWELAGIIVDERR